MKLTNNQILILLPVFNESKVISSVIRSIQKEGWKKILTVDDGSTDNTYDELKKNRGGCFTSQYKQRKGICCKNRT